MAKKSLCGAARAFIALIAFFTSIPIPRRYLADVQLFNHLYLLPVVGLIRGLVTVIPAVLAIALGMSNNYILVFAVIALHTLIQGLIHVDGFIDFSEAIFSHRFGVDGYRVVKDRYRGSYAIALFSLYILGLFSSMMAFIDRVPLVQLAGVLIILEVCATYTMLLLSFIGKTPPEGMGKVFKQSVRGYDLLVGLALALLIVFAVAHLASVTVVLLTAVAAAMAISLCISYSLAQKVLGFVNGDVLGFSSELFYLVSILLCWAMSWL